MSRHQQQKQASVPAKSPGDHLTSEEDRASRESSLSQIKAELQAARERDEARDAEQAKALATGNHPIKLAQTEETAEQRAKSFEATIALVKAEMDEQNSVNPPRQSPQGLDDASFDLIKAEMAKASKRVVLPSG